jgi:hypothetical protein
MIVPPRMTSRDLVPIVGHYSPLASAGDAEQRRERPFGPTGSVKLMFGS